MMDSSQASKLFEEFIASHNILIADPNGGARTGISKLLVGIGAKSSNIASVSTFEEAKAEIQKNRPAIIVCEYMLTGGNGIDLAQETRSYPNLNEKVFIVLTGNTSQSVVAQAAEEDVDLFLLKPYTIKKFSEALVKVVLTKLNPSEYVKMIEEGKKLLFEARPDEAIEVFNRAAELNPSPALALFYRGQAELLRTLIGSAEGSYKEGLKFNDIHYRCIAGLFDLLLNQKKLSEAYGVVKKITKVFPANPNRLGQVLSLAVYTGNLADIESYYETFQTIETRNDELIKYIGAAMVVTGKHFLKVGEKEKALNLLNKAAVSCAGRPNILREIVASLTESNLLKDAKAALDRFPPASRKSDHYLIARFLFQNAETKDPKKSLMELNQLARDGIKDPAIHYWLIRHNKAIGKTEEAENFKAEALRTWPKQQKYFETAYE